jgi:basic amino acid/polyamine antiporter, APA family
VTSPDPNNSAAASNRPLTPALSPDYGEEGAKATLDYASAPLRRQIGLFGAVMLGLGSILGTGVFVGLAQATALAGPWVLLAIVLAGLLAFCNAMSSAQLAAAYPVSGGTYEYGYRLLSPAWGFMAGWTFLLAKSASAATAALAVGFSFSWWFEGIWLDHMPASFYDLDFGRLGRIHRFDLLFLKWTGPLVAIGTVVFLVSAALVGVKRTNRTITATVMFTIAAIVVVCGAAMLDTSIYKWPASNSPPRPDSFSDVALAIALVFVAFTGYGRLATLGEEVINPARVIPRAMLIALIVAASLYLAVAGTNLLSWPYRHSTKEGDFVAIIADVCGHKSWEGFIIALSALTAMLGVLLNLILGLSRVWLAMGRRGDMPRRLAKVSKRSGTPVPATVLAGLAIAAIVLVGDVRLTWSFSAFSVLIYYAITNWACLRLPAEHRRYPRALAWIGLVSCLSLAWFVEVKVWAVGVGLIAVGLVWHRLRRGTRSGPLAPVPGGEG